MNGTVRERIGPRRRSPTSTRTSATAAIFVLSLLFFATGVLTGIIYRRLDADPVWVLLLVPFSFGMTGALVLFHFLHSSARIENSAYKVGGAIAGFIILFTSFYEITKKPFLEELEWYKVNNSAVASAMLSMTEAYDKVILLNNSSISRIADSSIANLRTTLWMLAKGTYRVDANELWQNLKPLITNVEHTFYATQYVLPESFWGQYWTKDYFKMNVEATKRGVDVLRIFIVDSQDANEDLIADLIHEHLKNGINIRIIDKRLLDKTFKREDLKDILIVDNKITGYLVLEKEGTFDQVEFSIDPQTVLQRSSNFERLRNVSRSFDDWQAALKAKNLQ